MDDVIVDIRRTAKLYIERHGKDAEGIARQLADDLLIKGQMEEHATLLEVVKAIQDLRESGQDKTIH